MAPWPGNCTHETLTIKARKTIPSITAVFRNMRTLSSQRLLRSAFLAAVNHNHGDIERTLKNRSKQNGSKSTSHDWQTSPFDPVKANFCFLRGPLGCLTAAKKVFRNSRWLEQSSHVSENRSNILQILETQRSVGLGKWHILCRYPKLCSTTLKQYVLFAGISY